MNHNGGDRYYMEEPGVDEEAEDRRREYEWNQYANRDSPHRSATEDYPRYEEERRRLDDRRDLREELNRDDCSSVYSNGSRSRSIPYRSRSRSPIRRRDRSGDREMRNDDRERSERSRWRNDDSPPYRRTYDRDDRRSPRERERRSSPYSSRSRDSGKDWSRRACPTVAIRYIPSSVVEVDIRDELRASRAHYIDLKMDYEEGPKNSSAAANHRVCYVEFETTRDAIQWMEEHQGSLRIGRDKMPMAYDVPEAREISISRRRDRSEYREDDDSDDDDRRRRGRLGTPTDTMIVKGMDYSTNEEQIRQSFEYITHFPIQDIRLVKDKYGKPRGFCFVQWRSVEDCTAVIEYLRTAKPRFHILGRHVELDYSSPQGSSRLAVTSRHMGNGNSMASGAAAAAIQAAHWSRGGNQPSRMPPAAQGSSTIPPSPQQQQRPPQMNNVPTPSMTPNRSQAAPALVKSSPQASVPYQAGMYPTPDISKFQYDSTSGYYYDAQTRLYYDANSRYFYNNISGQYLYWDESKKNYIAISAENQAKQQKASDKKESDQKEKESKSKTAKKIAKDMERWAKAQNRKKEEYKKLMEDPVPTTSVTTPAAVETKKESATADTVFSLLSKESAETERLKAVHAAYNQDSMFKKPDTSLLSTQRKTTASSNKTNGGLVSYMRSSDSEEEEDDDEDPSKYINWTKLACLLCRRAFPSKEVLSKHIEFSDLHKQNLLKKRNSKMGSLTANVKEEDKPSQIKYRDRAAERRSKFGVEKLDLKKSHSSRAPVPYEQPTKDGLDQTNIGNQMLQKMGWKQGSGLGKSQSGITDPITVQQRARGAGLGMRGASYGLDGSESGDYRKVAKKVTMARFYEGGHH